MSIPAAPNRSKRKTIAGSKWRYLQMDQRTRFVPLRVPDAEKIMVSAPGAGSDMISGR